MKKDQHFSSNIGNEDHIEGVRLQQSQPFLNAGDKSEQISISNDEGSKKDKGEKDLPKTSFLSLFRFAKRDDYILMGIGLVASMINGIALPMFALIFGQMTDSFSPTSSGDDVVSAAGQQSLYFLYLGTGSFFLSWIQMATWMISGERQSIEFRKNYFKAVMNQEVGWFDMINPNELSSKIASECFQIQGAIGEKVPTFAMTIFMTLGGFAVGYWRGWQMALVSTAALPIITIGVFAFALVIQTSQKKIAGAYEKAGGLAEQALNHVKTVKSLTGESFELVNYESNLIEALKIACRYGIWSGVGLGLTFASMFLDYALSFWYGAKLIDDHTMNSTMDRVYTQGDIFVVFFAIMIGGFSLGQMNPCLKNFATGQQAGKKVLEIIDRTPLITIPQNAQKISNLQGKIVFKNVNFNYPAKPDIPVHRSLNLSIEPNQTTALVGESGCGKSTVMQLLLRFYDPQSGQVLIDDHDVQTLDFNWLRKNVGYVGQEPVLFATTIRENLRFGREDATQEEMIQALKQANAWEFVKELENQLDTFVGNAGSQISGGQKQRICIARAILKNPQILLLDEATSALDRKNEAAIQKTLDEISIGRTTIVIAHRLSTVKNADRILVLDKGQLIEEGTYEYLMNIKGKFQGLAKNQIQKELEFDNKDTDTLTETPQELFLNKKDSRTISNRKSSIYQADQPKVESESVVQPQLTKEEKKKLEAEEKGMLQRLRQINKPEQRDLIFGSIFALANGVVFPISGVILGEFVDVLSRPESPTFRSDANMLCLYFIIIAVGAQIFSIFQMYFFTKVGEGLTLRVRRQVFEKMIKMPGGWFDKPENNPGTLSARLATDAHLINGLTSNVVSIQIQNLSSLVTGLTVAFLNSWSMSLIALGASPLMVIAGQLQAKFIQGFSENTDQAYKESGQIIMESVTNIRTVASFSNEKKIEQLFAEKLEKPYQLVIKKGNYAGTALGFSQLAMFGVYAIIFICGALLVKSYGLSIKSMFVSIFAILFAAFGAGNNNQFMADVGAAKTACKSLFAILDSEDELQISEKKVKDQVKQRVFGDIEFKNVSFKYPTRDAKVFDDLSLTIKSGQKVAFVGPSGSGKSSIFQLLLRFYDNFEGQILVDGRDIREYDIHEFRRSFGVVSQEPILFNGTIAENIKYNSDGVSFDDVKVAAEKANALGFIEMNNFEAIPQKNGGTNSNNKEGSGFDRKVGLKGSQISGGQKQRIAIARAVIKNPNILLLDEATSALDHENEKIVQDSLNQLMKGKTSLCVAHRISTIKDSDQIFVIEGGKLVEQGTYESLMARKQFFYRLNSN